ncbi:efflux RND transporter periplasmic adaptor subunit [Dongshaea marina]|uniref:efflux RND transporter periplasmic adaptor subunit n=1 Tax=Dongshaea marina TaxID=2047966 RepID=UPI000D3E63A2|nr:efflux RND transporter periplasmic adaptor subunit [Dongshaea marina]
MKNSAGILIALLSLLLHGCDKQANDPRSIIQPVNVVTVTKAKTTPLLKFPAITVAADRSILSFRIPGEIVRILVQAGDKVKEGQLLAQLDPRDYRLELDDAQAKYNSARSLYLRSSKLVDKGFIPKSKFDELKAEYLITQANLDLAKLRLSFTRLTAPFDGIISRIPVNAFENIQVGQTVMNIHNASHVDIQIQAPDLLYSRNESIRVTRKHPGAKVILPDGTSHRLTELKEFTTEPDPEFGSFLVLMTMPMPEDRLLLDGMSVEVLVDAQKYKIYKEGEVIIPIEAIINPDGQSLDIDEKYVWVVDENNKVSKRQIATDRVVPQGVRLLSGLKEGETIVVAGGNRLSSGQEVRIVHREVEPS